MRNFSRASAIAIINTAALATLSILIAACNQQTTDSNTTSPAASIPTTTKTMHPSWDADQDGINDCETDGSCDHTVDYSQPRTVATVVHQGITGTEQRGPFLFVCDDEPRSTFTATFFTTSTESDTLVLEHNQDTAELQQVPTASGSKYEGNEASFWEHHGETRITWRKSAAELVCKPTQ